MESRDEDDPLDERELPTGYTLGGGRTMQDVLDVQAKLLESEGLEPAWKQGQKDAE